MYIISPVYVYYKSLHSYCDFFVTRNLVSISFYIIHALYNTGINILHWDNCWIKRAKRASFCSMTKRQRIFHRKN